MKLNILRSLFCEHKDSQFIRNIYGDEIIGLGWKRSIWECNDCYKTIYKGKLNKIDND